jgi:probable HAF family extracellular repeat protein
MTTSCGIKQSFLAIALLLPLAQAVASPSYKVKVVAPAGSTAKAINASGAVVGSLPAGGNQHAFLYNGTHTYDLGTLGGPTSIAYGINDFGVVVGQADNTTGRPRAFYYWHGKMTSLGTFRGGDLSVATGINEAGVITGYSGTGAKHDFGIYGFRYQHGHLQLLEALPAGLGSFGYAINMDGVIAGAAYEGPFTAPEYPHYPTIFKHNLPLKLSAYEGEANALNDHGQVVGGINTYDLPFPHGRRAVLWQSGIATYLGSLDDSIFDSYAVGINNAGVVIGNSALTISSDHYAFRPFIWTRHSGIRNINTLIDPASGWEVTDAEGINDKGQIAGTACKAGLCYAVRLDRL